MAIQRIVTFVFIFLVGGTHFTPSQQVDSKPDDLSAITAVAMRFTKALEAGDVQAVRKASLPQKNGFSAVPNGSVKNWRNNGLSFHLEESGIKIVARNASDVRIRLSAVYSTALPGGKAGEAPYLFDLTMVRVASGYLVKNFDTTAMQFLQEYLAKDTVPSDIYVRYADLFVGWAPLNILDYIPSNDTASVLERKGRLLRDIESRIVNKAFVAQLKWYIGVNFAARERWDEAEKEYGIGKQLAEQENDEYALFLNLTGNAELKILRGHVAEGRVDAEKALKLFATRADAFGNALWASRKIGNALYNTHLYADAFSYYVRGADIAHAFRAGEQEASFLKDAGEAKVAEKDFRLAVDFFQRSLGVVKGLNSSQIAISLSDTYGSLGSVYDRMDQAQLSAQAYGAAIASLPTQGDPKQLRDRYIAFAQVYLRRGDIVNGKRILDRMVTRRARDRSTSDLAADIEEAARSIAFDGGRLNLAIELVDKWAMSAKFPDKDLAELAFFRASLSFLNGNLKVAEASFAKIAENPSSTNENKAMAYFFTGMIHCLQSFQNDQVQCGPALERAELVAETSSIQSGAPFIKFFRALMVGPNEDDDDQMTTIRVARSKKLLDEVANDSRSDRFLSSYAKAMSVAFELVSLDTIPESDSETRKKLIDKVAGLLNEVEQSASSIEDESSKNMVLAYIAAITVALYQESQNSEGALEKIAEANRRFGAAFGRKGDPIYEIAEGNLLYEMNKFPEAIERFTKAAELSENRKIAGGLSGRLLAARSSHGIYTRLVAALVHEKKVDAAILTTERDKSRVIREMLRYRDGLRSGGGEILVVKLSPALPNPNGLLQPVRRDTRPSWLRYEEFMPGLNVPVIDPENVDEPDTPLLTVDLHRTKALVTDPETIIVDYFVTEDKVYVFTLGDETGGSVNWKDKLEWHVTSLDDHPGVIRAAAYNLADRVTQRSPGYSPFGKSLFKSLITPIRNELKGKRKIVIVPDDFLWSVPFQALQDPSGRFLLEDHTLYYIPSLSLVDTSNRRGDGGSLRTPQTKSSKVLALGVKDYGPVDRSPQPMTLADIIRNEGKDQETEPIYPVSLQGAVKEVIAVQKMYGSEQVRALTKPTETTKKMFLRLAPDFDVLHIATHSLTDQNDPTRSALLFSGSKTSELLTAEEILLIPNLRARLVILSACGSASGESVGGEGLISLTWAFLAAGVPEVVASQWQVDDESTVKLMSTFHRNLMVEKPAGAHGGGSPESLRTAALELMGSNKKYIHPYYWAPFITITTNAPR